MTDDRPPNIRKIFKDLLDGVPEECREDAEKSFKHFIDSEFDGIMPSGCADLILHEHRTARQRQANLGSHYTYEFVFNHLAKQGIPKTRDVFGTCQRVTATGMLEANTTDPLIIALTGCIRYHLDADLECRCDEALKALLPAIEFLTSKLEEYDALAQRLIDMRAAGESVEDGDIDDIVTEGVCLDIFVKAAQLKVKDTLSL